MLSDPQSEIIRAFGILNSSIPEGHPWHGIPYPGIYIVDEKGVVRSKYFQETYQERYSAPSILLREFGSLAGTRETVVQTAHLELKYYATRDVVRPSLRLTLVADFQLPAKMHVYAPGVANYIPIQWKLNASPYYVAHAVEYPPSEWLYLPAIQETVPVYHGKFRIAQDITLAGGDVLRPILSGEREVRLSGQFRYQACDDKICYLPQDIPLEWTLQVEPLDTQRVPEAIQHPPPPERRR
ncbi:MAG: redoxin domain-containing protein [Acidobacteria bacterium]|nr:redoxin domain-containing protein [Acidobacteriota bacterium]